MKLLNIIFLSIALTLISSCNNEDKMSDAYGNFEADEMIIAAETQGKVIGLFANEGDEVKARALLCVIDTTQLSLKIEQLFSSIGAVGAKTQDVKTQIDVLYKKKENIIREMKRIENLLKDNYTIKETQAPNGYELTESVHVTPADFDSTLKLATKLIVNKKITTTTTVAPTTTTTTTPAQTTTGGATETPEKSGNAWILIVVAGVVVLGGGAAAAVVAVKKKKEN